jgi:hypothetical protein
MRTASEIDLNKLLKTPRTTPFSSSTSLDHQNTIRTERLRKLLLGTIEDDVAETCLSCVCIINKHVAPELQAPALSSYTLQTLSLENPFAL